jgi:hypothetical protein
MNTKAKETHDQHFTEGHTEIDVINLEEFITLARELKRAKIKDTPDGKIGEIVTPGTSIQEVVDLLEKGKYQSLSLDNVEDMYHYKTEESKYS